MLIGSIYLLSKMISYEVTTMNALLPHRPWSPNAIWMVSYAPPNYASSSQYRVVGGGGGVEEGDKLAVTRPGTVSG